MTAEQNQPAAHSADLPLWGKLLSLTAIIVFFTWLIFGDFVSGQVMPYHDSLSGITMPHILFERLARFSLPLWSPEINAGQPLWPILENWMYFDPIMAPVWFLGTAMGFSGVVLAEITMLGWLTAFSLGGLLLSRQFTKNWWLNLTVFTLLFAGPVAWSLPAQWNLILIYKYFPFALLALTAFLKQPDYRSGVTLGVACSLASAGFQTVYPLFAAAVFTAAYAAVLLRQKRLVLPPFGVAALTAGLLIWGNISLIASGWELASMTAVPRLSVGGWTMTGFDFINGLLLPVYARWHGSTAIGLAAVATILVPVAFFLAALVKRKWPDLEPEQNALGAGWLFMAAVLCVPAAGLFGLAEYFEKGHYFLHQRNWGLEITLIILGFSQLAALGAEALSAGKAQGRIFLWCWAVTLAGLMATLLHFNLPGAPIGIWQLTKLLLQAALVPAGFFALYYLARKKITPTAFGVLFFVCNTGVLAVELARAAPVYGLGNSAHYALTPTKKAPILPQTRDWKFDEYKHFPFAMLGPAALHVYTASMTATMAPQFTSMEAPTHCIDLIQLPRFTTVMTRVTDTAARRIQGNTLPVARLVYAVTRASCTEEAISLIQKNTHALSRWAPVEGPVPDHIVTPPLSRPGNPGRITLAEYREELAVFEVEQQKDGVFIFADNWAPHWRVYVDGKPASLLIANATNKAVFLPKGKHTVRFEYFPAAYVAALGLNALFYLLTVPAALLLSGQVLRRKRQE